MTYDEAGNMLTMTNRSGENMEFTYYDNGQIHTVRVRQWTPREW